METKHSSFVLRPSSFLLGSLAAVLLCCRPAAAEVATPVGIQSPYTLAGGTVTANSPPLTITQTWNNAGVQFGSLGISITDMDSLEASQPFYIEVDGFRRFGVRRNGSIQMYDPSSGNQMIISISDYNIDFSAEDATPMSVTCGPVISGSYVQALGNVQGSSLTASTGNVSAAGDVSATGSVRYTPAAKTIATDAIAATGSYHVVDTEGGAATDNLATISGGTTGDVLIVRAANSARDVVIKDGTGNIRSVGDFTLNNVEDTISLIFDGTNWLETARSDNGA
jgi:hypothetical protein